MEIAYSETITTEHQLALAARVEEFLRTSARYQRDVVQSRGQNWYKPAGGANGFENI